MTAVTNIKTARQLQPGDTIHQTGTTKHRPITVTEIVVNPVTGLVAVHGFNERDATPRLIFRHLAPGLAVKWT